MDLNSRMKFIREVVLRYTQEDMAKLLGLKSRQTIYEFETGKIKPSIEYIRIIADKCIQQGYDFKDVLTWLTTGEGEISPPTYNKHKQSHPVQEPQTPYNGSITISVSLPELNIIEKMRQLPEAGPMIDSILTSWLTINNTLQSINSSIKVKITDTLQK